MSLLDSLKNLLGLNAQQNGDANEETVMQQAETPMPGTDTQASQTENMKTQDLSQPMVEDSDDAVEEMEELE